jgi:hypothetical protein
VFAPSGQARTFNFHAGDVGFVPFAPRESRGNSIRISSFCSILLGFAVLSGVLATMTRS